MSNTDFVSAFGQSAQILNLMSRLAHQLKTQGGEQSDIKLLENDRILERVAQVMIRAGQLRKPFHIWMENGPDSWIQIYLQEINCSNFSELNKSSFWQSGARLATTKELELLWKKYPDILKDEDELTIVGERIESIGPNLRHYVMSKSGIRVAYYRPTEAFDANYRFAVTFDPKY